MTKEISDSKKEIFERTPVPRAVLQLTLPTMFSSIVMILYNLADTYYVGLLNDPVQNAAVTLAAPVMLGFYSVNNLFGVGSSGMMSRALGRKDYETAARSSAFGFYGTVFSGLCFSAVYLLFRTPLLTLLGADQVTAAPSAAYMLWTVAAGAVPSMLNVVLSYLIRAEGATLVASLGVMGGCLMNIVLDPFFVLPFGLGLGAAGAGMATCFSNSFACLFFLIWICKNRRTTFVCIDPRKFGIRKEIVSEVFSVGIPAAIQNILNVSGMTILNNLAAAYGAEAVAAMGISQKISTLPMDIALGFTQGTMPLISYNYASGNRKRMKETILFSGRLMTAMMVAATIILCLMPGVFVSLFSKNETVIAYGIRFLIGISLSMPFLRIDYFAVNIFQSVGMGRITLWFAILRKAVLEIPAQFLLNALFQLPGLAYSRLAAEAVMALVATVSLNRLFKRLERETQGKEEIMTALTDRENRCKE